MNCTAHPQEPITGTCDRCGDFVCRLDSETKDGKTTCLECRQAAMQGWLGAFKAECWGKRDSYAWLLGGVGLLYTIGALFQVIAALSRGASATGFVVIAFLFGVGVVQAAYLYGARWARVAIIVLPVISCGAVVAIDMQTSGNGAEVIFPVLALVLPIGGYFDTRNKLFFEIDVPEPELTKLWDRTRNNTIASTGVGLGVIGLLIPGVGIAGLICSVIALARVNPNADPPIGKKGYAIAGVVLSAIGTVFWGVIFGIGALR